MAARIRAPNTKLDYGDLKNIHEPQDMAHARKMKTISQDTIFMGNILKQTAGTSVDIDGRKASALPELDELVRVIDPAAMKVISDLRAKKG